VDGAPGTLRVGVIGCGRVATLRHLPALARLPDAQVVAVADLDPARAARVAEAYGVPRHGADGRALIDDPGIDLFLVAVPPAEHAAVAVPALRAGKHVFCEKPLALGLADARAIRDAAAEASGRSTVGFNLRSHRLFLDARTVVRSGALGRLAGIRTVYTARVRLDDGLPAWRDSLSAGGGAITEIGVHHLDLLRYLTGRELAWVSAAARSPGGADAAEHSAVLRVALDDGTLVTGLYSEVTREAQELELWGDLARLRVNVYRYDGLEVDPADSYDADPGRRVGKLVKAVREVPHALRARKLGGDYVASYTAQWEHFLGAIRDGGALRCTVEDGYRAVLATAAARRSIEGGGRRVALAEIERSEVGTPGTGP
jgi:predicted dehydrogenase